MDTKQNINMKIIIICNNVQNKCTVKNTETS